MSIPSFNVTHDLPGLEPDAEVEVEYGEVIECDVAIPAAEDVHVLLIDHCRVPEPDLRLTQQVQVARDLVLAQQSFVVVRVRKHLFHNYWLPAVSANLVLVNV